MSIRSSTIIQVEDNQSLLDRLEESGTRYVTRRSSTVEALYDLCFKKDGAKICMHKGERYKLLKKANQDWWLVKKLPPSKLASTKLKLASNYCQCALERTHNNSNDDDTNDYDDDDGDGDDDIVAKDADDNGDTNHDESRNNEIRDNLTFYAPANYLKEVKLIHKVPSPRFAKRSEMCFNSLDSEISCDSDVDDVDSGNHDDVEISSNTAATSSRESLIEEESTEWVKQNCDSKVDQSSSHSKANDNKFRSYSPPAYVNLPLVCKKPAPVPSVGTKPVRILLNHWAEYVEPNGRKYYYNSLSRESSWKPPRRKLSNLNDDDDVTSHSEENLTDSSITSLSTSNSKENSLSRSRGSPEPLARGSRLRTNVRFVNKESPDKKDEDLRSLSTLTIGWTRHVDQSNEIYYVNDKTKGKYMTMAQNVPRASPLTGEDGAKESEAECCSDSDDSSVAQILEEWFCKVDENGRLYFFEENGTESYWELPDLSDELPIEESIEKSQSSSTTAAAVPVNENSSSDKNASEERPSASKILRPAPTLPSSLLQPTRLTALERSMKAKSMAFLPITDRLASSPIIPISLLHSDSKNEDRNSAQFPSEPPSTLQDAKLFMIVNTEGKRSLSRFNNNITDCINNEKVIKSGTLNRTKVMENGRRIRKNWSLCFVALTDYFLMLFKETKLITGSLKPEMTIELSGALIEWSQKSSRKNVLQVTTVAGHQILLQDDCPITSKAWFDSIRSAILKLPSTIVSHELETDIEAPKDCKLKRSKSSKQIRKPEGNSKDIGQVLANIPPDKKKKIKDRLKLFLRRRPTLDSIRDKGIYKDEPVFGCNLSSLCQSEKQCVPRFVKECIEAIEKKDLKADGIYRACGNLSTVQRIRYQVNHDNYTGIWSEEDVHVLTGALKLFFRDMQEPLFPCSLFDPLMEAISLRDRRKKFEAIKAIVSELAKPHHETLKYLLQHLLRVKDFSDENRMHIQNLAIVFGPTLMRPEEDSNNFAYDMMLRMHSNQAIEFLLLEYQNIFS